MVAAHRDSWSYTSRTLGSLGTYGGRVIAVYSTLFEWTGPLGGGRGAGADLGCSGAAHREVPHVLYAG